jgi:hypothetical protein
LSLLVSLRCGWVLVVLLPAQQPVEHSALLAWLLNGRCLLLLLLLLLQLGPLAVGRLAVALQPWLAPLAALHAAML